MAERDIERLRAEGHTANRQLRQDLDSSFRNELEKIKEQEIRQEFSQHIEEESNLLKSEILDQTVRIIKNCDDSCDGVSYDIVSFQIPNPQHTVSLYTFIYQESAWSGRSGLSFRKYPETIELI